ncbi:hypothetical protein Tco_1416677 [Tanacetum coccineum]
MVKTVDVSGFPGLESGDKIKTVLERYTGNGSIKALEVKQTNGGTRAYARVQFTTREKVLPLAISCYAIVTVATIFMFYISLNFTKIPSPTSLKSIYGSGNLREVVRVPPGEDLNEWLCNCRKATQSAFVNVKAVFDATIEVVQLILARKQYDNMMYCAKSEVD